MTSQFEDSFLRTLLSPKTKVCSPLPSDSRSSSSSSTVHAVGVPSFVSSPPICTQYRRTPTTKKKATRHWWPLSPKRRKEVSDRLLPRSSIHMPGPPQVLHIKSSGHRAARTLGHTHRDCMPAGSSTSPRRWRGGFGCASPRCSSAGHKREACRYVEGRDPNLTSEDTRTPLCTKASIRSVGPPFAASLRRPARSAKRLRVGR